MQNSSLQIYNNSQAVERVNPNHQILLTASDKDLNLESFLKYAIDNRLRGEDLEAAAKVDDENRDYKPIELSYRQIRRRLDQYIKNGLKGIVRQERPDKFEPKAFSNEVLQLMKDIFKDFQVGIRTYEEVHKKLRSVSVRFTTFKTITNTAGKTEKVIDEEFNISDGVLFQAVGKTTIFTTKFTSGEYITKVGEILSIGSYESAKRYFKEYKQVFNSQLHMVKYGLHSYRLKKQHSIKRDYSDMFPNKLWSADNKLLDLIVIDWDWRTVRRFWLSGYLRVSSRQYSYELCASPNAESVSNAFVNAAKKWGLPEEINHDRGKDYLSVRTTQMWESLGIKETVSMTKNARAKIIEPFHNILDQKLKCVTGYTGNKYEEMPQATRDMLREYTQVTKDFKDIEKKVFDADFKITLNNNLEGKLKKSKKRFLHVSELLDVIDQALAEYEETLHGGLSDDKLGRQVYNRLCEDELINEFSDRLNTPKGRLEYYLRSGFKPVFARPEVLALFAMESAIRTVQLSGISLRGNEYIASRLTRVTGKRVLIKYTNSLDKYVFVFTSPEIDKIPDDKALRSMNGYDIIKDAEFVCVCEKRKAHDYGSPTFLTQLHEQRAEEKNIQKTFGITKTLKMDSNIKEISNQAKEIYSKNKPTLKLKDTFDE